jgi:hypothetical protein
VFSVFDRYSEPLNLQKSTNSISPSMHGLPYTFPGNFETLYARNVLGRKDTSGHCEKQQLAKLYQFNNNLTIILIRNRTFAPANFELLFN